MVGFLKTNGTQCRFVSLISNTEPKLRKDCPFVGVRKISKKIGLINANYNTSVRNRIAEKLGVTLNEVEYVNGEVWYQHLTTEDGKNLPVVVNKKKNDGKHYIQFFPHSSTNTFVGEDGKEIAESELKPFFYKQAERPDYKPCVVSIDLGNICELKASGVIIQTPNFEEAEAILAQ